MLKNLVFYVELNSYVNNFNVSQFHHSHWFYEHFQKQPFAGVLQNSWSQYSELKRDSNKGVSCEYCELLRWLRLHLLKEIKQLFHKGVNVMTFFSTRFRETIV